MIRASSSPTKPSTSTPRAHDKSHAKNALTAATRERLTLMCGDKWELVPPHALQATWFERTSGKQSGKYPSAHGTHLQGIEHMTLDKLQMLVRLLENIDKDLDQFLLTPNHYDAAEYFEDVSLAASDALALAGHLLAFHATASHTKVQT